MSNVNQASDSQVDSRPHCTCGHKAAVHDIGYDLATCTDTDCDCDWYVAYEGTESAEQYP